MVGRAYRLRLRRRVKVGRKQASELGHGAELSVDKHFLRRLDRLVPVSRFVVAWVALLLLLGGVVIIQSQNLSNYYEVLKPVSGGVQTEGMIGSFTTANPLYAANQVDASVSHLIFSSLFTYNDRGELVGDLAKNWKLDASETHYTVELKNNLVWQDGHSLTADDVAFTYKTIQDPDAKSPYFSSWQNVNVEATKKNTIVFSLDNPLSSFVDSLTNGIVPKHILSKIPVGDLRTVPFNTVSSVGSGPFSLKRIEVRGNAPGTREDHIVLAASDSYHLGKPKLDGLVIQAFNNKPQMIKQFKSEKIDAMIGLQDIPKGIKDDSGVMSYSFPLNAQVMTFFKVSHGVLADSKVRHALVLATNRKAVINQLGYPAVAVTEPLLRNQLGYDADLQQADFNLAAANKALTKAGWKLDKNGIRSRAGVELGFTLYTKNTPEFVKVSRLLREQWRAAGANVHVVAQGDSDFDNTLANHQYDALLYGISTGIDPDVYAFWHSSQADVRSSSRVNFSEYKSTVADDSISAGRTRFNKKLRVVKYKPFLKAWKKDAPAVGLYQPRFLYITRGQVYGLRERPINSVLGHYTNIENWMIKRARVAYEK